MFFAYFHKLSLYIPCKDSLILELYISVTAFLFTFANEKNQNYSLKH